MAACLIAVIVRSCLRIAWLSFLYHGYYPQFPNSVDHINRGTVVIIGLWNLRGEVYSARAIYEHWFLKFG